MQLPEIGKLSIEAKEEKRRIGGIRIILDTTDRQNNIFGEPDSAVFEPSQNSRITTPPKARQLEETKLSLKQTVLGNQSFSDNTAGSK